MDYLVADNADFNGDIRKLKSGRLRIRFKLSYDAEQILFKTLDSVAGRHPHTRLEYLCLDYLSSGGCEINCKLPSTCIGNRRFLVKLFPDQITIVYEAFKLAKKRFSGEPSAEQLLTFICLNYTYFDQPGGSLLSQSPASSGA